MIQISVLLLCSSVICCVPLPPLIALETESSGVIEGHDITLLCITAVMNLDNLLTITWLSCETYDEPVNNSTGSGFKITNEEARRYGLDLEDVNTIGFRYERSS